MQQHRVESWRVNKIVELNGEPFIIYFPCKRTPHNDYLCQPMSSVCRCWCVYLSMPRRENSIKEENQKKKHTDTTHTTDTENNRRLLTFHIAEKANDERKLKITQTPHTQWLMAMASYESYDYGYDDDEDDVRLRCFLCTQNKKNSNRSNINITLYCVMLLNLCGSFIISLLFFLSVSFSLSLVHCLCVF